MHEKLASESVNSGTNVLRFQTLVGIYDRLGEDEAFSQIDGMMPCTEIIQWFVTYEHAFGSYVDELKAMGYTDVDYSPVLSSTPATPTMPDATESPTPAPAPTPTAFVVAPLDPPKTMWATQQVNYRDGADTTYNKIGQLNQHDQITVVGIASTNWYQFSLDGGATYVYASNKYFTEVDPSVIDMTIEQSEEEAEQKESELAEVETVSIETTEEAEKERIESSETSESETESETQSEEVISDMTEDTTIAESSDTVEVNDENSEEIVINETVSVLKWQYIVLGAILIVMAGFIISMVKKHKK